MLSSGFLPEQFAILPISADVVILLRLRATLFAFAALSLAFAAMRAFSSTTEGGTHETGFKSALTRALNDFGRAKNIIKDKQSNFTGEDYREGLTAILTVKMQNMQFERIIFGSFTLVEMQYKVAYSAAIAKLTLEVRRSYLSRT